MKKTPVLIRIETCRSRLSEKADDAPDTENLSSTEFGTIRRTRNGYRIDIDSDDGNTVIDTFGTSVSMNVDGNLSSSLVFSDKETTTGTYCTPDALLQVMTHTYKVDNTLSEHGGSLLLDYEIMLGGSVCERCVTTFTPLALGAGSVS